MKSNITKITKIIKGSLVIAFLLAVILGTVGILGLSLYFGQNFIFMSIASFKIVSIVFVISFIALSECCLLYLVNPKLFDKLSSNKLLPNIPFIYEMVMVVGNW